MVGIIKFWFFSHREYEQKLEHSFGPLVTTRGIVPNSSSDEDDDVTYSTILCETDL